MLKAVFYFETIAGLASRRPSNRYIAGTSNNVKSVENVSPLAMVMASGCNSSEPSPRPSASGSIPTTVVSVVIRIGRRRRRPASMSAWSTALPRFRSSSTYSTRTMVLFTTMPACARSGDDEVIPYTRWSSATYPRLQARALPSAAASGARVSADSRLLACTRSPEPRAG